MAGSAMMGQEKKKSFAVNHGDDLTFANKFYGRFDKLDKL